MLNNKIEWDIPEEFLVNLKAINKNIVNGKFSKLIRLIMNSFQVFWHLLSYDIILVNGDLFELTIPTFFSKCLLRKKVIYWIHASLSEAKYYPNIFFKLIHAHTLKHSDAIAFSSYRSVKSFCKYTNLIESDLFNHHVIYNLLTEKKISNGSIKSPFLKNNSLHLVALGRLTWEKNFALLINAIKLAKDKYDLDCELIICGNGHEYDSLGAQISELNLSDQIHLIGQVDNPFDYIAKSDVLISSSYDTESLPMVVGEALLCNKPVIATRTGAAEILEYGKYGLVVDINDKEQLAHAIYKMSDPNLREYYSKLAPEALMKFNPEKIMLQWLDLLKDL